MYYKHLSEIYMAMRVMYVGEFVMVYLIIVAGGGN